MHSIPECNFFQLMSLGREGLGGLSPILKDTTAIFRMCILPQLHFKSIFPNNEVELTFSSKIDGISDVLTRESPACAHVSDIINIFFDSKLQHGEFTLFASFFGYFEISFGTPQHFEQIDSYCCVTSLASAASRSTVTAHFTAW